MTVPGSASAGGTSAGSSSHRIGSGEGSDIGPDGTSCVPAVTWITRRSNGRVAGRQGRSGVPARAPRPGARRRRRAVAWQGPAGSPAPAADAPAAPARTPRSAGPGSGSARPRRPARSAAGRRGRITRRRTRPVRASRSTAASRTTRTRPSTTMKNPVPISPARAITAPAGNSTSAATSATICSSLAPIPVNSGQAASSSARRSLVIVIGGDLLVGGRSNAAPRRRPTSTNVAPSPADRQNGAPGAKPAARSMWQPRTRSSTRSRGCPSSPT